MSRPRSPGRKAFPPNLQQNAAGYFSWRDPRSGKTHGIPLSLRLDVTGWALKDIIERCRTPGLISPHLVHHRASGGHYSAGDPVTLNRVSNAFAEAVVAAGLAAEAGRTLPTFHEIRSLSIRLYTAQSGQEFAQALAGHKDAKTTLLYTDPRDSEAVRIMIPDPSIRTNIERVSNDDLDV